MQYAEESSPCSRRMNHIGLSCWLMQLQLGDFRGDYGVLPGLLANEEMAQRRTRRSPNPKPEEVSRLVPLTESWEPFLPFGCTILHPNGLLSPSKETAMGALS